MHKKIKHGFFGRLGGKSIGIYKSLNCGPGSKDKKNKVTQNLKIVKKKISKSPKEIFLLNQIHSSKLIYINKNSKPNSQKEPLYPWILSHVFKTLDDQINNKNIECFAKVEQKCHQENFHYFIFVNVILFLRDQKNRAYKILCFIHICTFVTYLYNTSHL